VIATETIAEVQGASVKRDGYGALDRVPPPPKRGILVLLRRNLKTLRGQVDRVDCLRREVAEIENKLAGLTSPDAIPDRRVAERALTRRLAVLETAVAKRNYGLRRLGVLLEAAETRSSRSHVALKTAGADEIKRLVLTARTTLDSVLVRERLPGSDEAYMRLRAASEATCRRLIHRANAHNMLDPWEPDSRLGIAVLRAAEQWDWTKASAFTSYAFAKVRRELQLRSRHERPILSEQQTDGTYSRAASLDSLVADPEQSFAPLAVKVGEAVVSASSARRQVADADVVRHDVTSALATLSASDQVIARRALIDKDAIAAIAKDMDVSVTYVRARKLAIEAALRSALRGYQEREKS